MLAVVNTPQHPEYPTAVEDVQPPEPAPDEVLVRVAASSINRGELSLLAARPAGWRPGQDVAGTVERAAADGTGPAAGTRVVALAEGAAWSGLVAVPATRVAVLDDTVSFEQAATLPIAGMTALRTLRYGDDLSGKRVLVTGASGGVGRFQVELAARSGAQVTAVAREAHAGAMISLGAGAVVDTTADAAGVFDLVTESVGGESLAAAITRLRPGGTLVMFGNSSGAATPISLMDFIGHEQACIQLFMSYASEQPFAPDLAVLVAAVAAGRLHPHIGRSVTIDELNSAVAAMRERRVHGKVVLKLT